MTETDLHDLAKESNEIVRLERLTHHIQRIREGQDEMKQSMQKMADAVSRLALVEERQANTGTALERIGATLAKLDERLRVLEIAEPMQAKSANWVERSMWAAAGFGLMTLLGKVGALV